MLQLLICVSSAPLYIAFPEYYCGVKLINHSSVCIKYSTRRVQWVLFADSDIILWSKDRFKDVEKKQCIICIEKLILFILLFNTLHMRTIRYVKEFCIETAMKVSLCFAQVFVSLSLLHCTQLFYMLKNTS